MRTDAEQATAEALAGGVRFFQYRAKRASRRAVHAVCARLAPLLRDAGAVFVVNDHADIAAAVDADGVHLGQDDLPVRDARKVLGRNRIIGISTHSIEQARTAAEEGADYIGFGPVFSTATKDAGPIQGVEALGSVCKAVGIPVVAIGGINDRTAGAAALAGARGIAVISAVLSSEDISASSRRIAAAFGQ